MSSLLLEVRVFSWVVLVSRNELPGLSYRGWKVQQQVGVGGVPIDVELVSNFLSSFNSLFNFIAIIVCKSKFLDDFLDAGFFLFKNVILQSDVIFYE